MRKRLEHFDVIKLIAILWIFWVHFIDDYRPELFRFWTEPPYSWFLAGMTGKLGVAVFAVILGYFAYEQGREKDLLNLTVKRYLSFFVMEVFINTVVLFWVEKQPVSMLNMKRLVYTSLVIGDAIFPTLWCMRVFLWGSIISYISGKYRLSLFSVLLLTAIFVVTHNPWIAVCLMGNVLWILTSQAEGENIAVYRWSRDGRIQVLALVFAFFALKYSAFGIAWQESEAVYLIYGICSFLSLLVFTVNQRICKLLSNHTLARFGKSSMGIYLLHPLIYGIFGSVFKVENNPSMLCFLTAFLVSVCVTAALSIVTVKLLNQCTAGLYQVFLKIRARFIPMDLSA